MATQNELVYDVRERHNAYSDDSNLSDEHIAFMLMSHRNRLLQQYMSNLKHGVPANALQVVCLNLEVDPQCFDDFDVVKSIQKIPTTIHNTGRNDLYQVHTPGSRFTKNINIIDYRRLQFLHGSRYIGSQLYVAVDQFDHLVAYNTLNKHILLEQLQVEGVFENPEEAYNLSCESNEIPFEETQFPIPDDLIPVLVSEVSNALMGKKNIPVDNINNAEDVTVGAQPQTK